LSVPAPSAPITWIWIISTSRDHLVQRAGCNARGVVDYVLGSLLTLAEIEGVDLTRRTYGVVGAGEVGGRLVKVLQGLGWKVLVCDPPRHAAEGGDYVSLEQIIEQCDVISLHTPLTKQGAHSTWHLFDQKHLNRLKPGTWLINASRGPVVDNAPCAGAVAREDLQAVLDVWEGEPEVDVASAELCVLATPHIAGYSLDGKQRGTAQIYQAYCDFLGQSAEVSLSDLLPAPWLSEATLSAESDPAWALAMLCRGVYDPRRDDADFRRSLRQRERATCGVRCFAQNYPSRREIDGLKVRIEGDSPALRQIVAALGASAL
jgi:erythronate-4-phosphate dehydrogenase